VSYINALKYLKILLQEDLKDPLVGAVDVRYRKAKIPIDRIDVPAARKNKKRNREKKETVLTVWRSSCFRYRRSATFPAHLQSAVRSRSYECCDSKAERQEGTPCRSWSPSLARREA
jgi:hypothetical protein